MAAASEAKCCRKCRMLTLLLPAYVAAPVLLWAFWTDATYPDAFSKAMPGALAPWAAEIGLGLRSRGSGWVSGSTSRVGWRGPAYRKGGGWIAHGQWSLSWLLVDVPPTRRSRSGARVPQEPRLSDRRLRVTWRMRHGDSAGLYTVTATETGRTLGVFRREDGKLVAREMHASTLYPED